MSTRLFIVGMKPITVQRKTVRMGKSAIVRQLGVDVSSIHYQGSYKLAYSTQP